jgi:8-oxo-dGTP diphosphatase
MTFARIFFIVFASATAGCSSERPQKEADRNLASYSGVDPDAEGGTLRDEFFVVGDVPSDALLITEGSLLIVERDDLLGLKRLAPSAKFALSIFSTSEGASELVGV